MKVLMVSSDNNPTSGAFLSEVKLCQFLIEKYGNKVLVILPEDGEGKRLLEEAQVPYIIVPSYDWVTTLDCKKNLIYHIKRYMKQLYNQKAIFKIAKIVKEEKVDIIHINTTYAYVGAKAALLAQKPFVWHIREYLEEGQARTLWNRPRGNKLLAKANRLVCISSSIYSKYLPTLKGAHLCVIPNGIDTDTFYKPNHTIFKSDIITMVYGGGYSIRKGVYDLARACALLRKKDIDYFRLICIGETTDKFKKFVNSLGISEYVEFIGYQKEPAKWYECADIAFNCSVFEGFGRTTVEAMLAGALVIGSDTGGTLDIIKPDKTGLLYHQGNAQNLSSKIEYAIMHPDEMRSIAENGREYAKIHFSASKNADSINALYREILREIDIKRNVDYE